MAAKGYDVIAVGCACIDYVATVDHLPGVDEKMSADNLLIQGGGLAATAMVAVARLGGKAALVTSVGDDLLGSDIISGLEAEGVDVSLSRVRKGATSLFSFCMIQKDTGLRTLVSVPAGAESLRAEELDPDAIRSAKVLLIDGTHARAQAAAARIAKDAGVPVICDADSPNAVADTLVPLTDVLIASSGSGPGAVAGGDAAAAARALFARGELSVAAVTAGTSGAFFETAEGPFHQRAFKVPVVDTIGAGDAFHGAYAYGMARGAPPRECARLAAAVAALKCTRRGGRTGLPTLAEVEAFLASGPEMLQ